MQKYHHYTEVVDSLGLGKAVEEKPRIDVCLPLRTVQRFIPILTTWLSRFRA